MASKTFIFVLAAMATACLAQNAEEGKKAWHVIEMPDPINYPSLCGRNGPSFVCDPENILPLVKADDIDMVLQDIYNTTTVPCYTAQASKRKGYLVMLAVVPKMQKFFTSNFTDNMNTRYLEGRSFAYHLGRDGLWGRHSSNCKEMIIILYSKKDMVLYTSTQQNARNLLRDEYVQNVMMSTLTSFFPFNTDDMRAANAIKYMVTRYSEKLHE